jgi:hypothetical protein
MTQQSVIFAVVWVDFEIPMHIICNNAADAICKAADMHARATASGVEVRHLRAIELDAINDFKTLWSVSA